MHNHHSLLIVDCSPEIHALFDVILQPLDLEIRHALSGQEALEALSIQRPSLIILEPQMSSPFGLDGLGLLNHLAQSPATANIHVIISSTAPYKTCRDYKWPAQVVDVTDKFRLDISQFRDLVQARLAAIDTTATLVKSTCLKAHTLSHEQYT